MSKPVSVEKLLKAIKSLETDQTFELTSDMTVESIAIKYIDHEQAKAREKALDGMYTNDNDQERAE